MCMLGHAIMVIEYDRDSYPGARWIAAKTQPTQQSEASSWLQGTNDEFHDASDTCGIVECY